MTDRVHVTALSEHIDVGLRDIFTNCQSSIAARQIASNEADARACLWPVRSALRMEIVVVDAAAVAKKPREQSEASFALIIHVSTCDSFTRAYIYIHTRNHTLSLYKSFINPEIFLAKIWFNVIIFYIFLIFNLKFNLNRQNFNLDLLYIY